MELSEKGGNYTYNFIKQNYEKGEKVIIYGYSYGGDFAVELASFLKEKEIEVDLLITVDASDGIFQNITVDTEVPDNVKVAVNWYQTKNSGFSSFLWSTDQSSSGSSGSSDGSGSGTSNFPGSNGGPNTAENPNKTHLTNTDYTNSKVTHGNIDEHLLEKNSKLIDNVINSKLDNK